MIVYIEDNYSHFVYSVQFIGYNFNDSELDTEVKEISNPLPTQKTKQKKKQKKKTNKNKRKQKKKLDLKLRLYYSS